MERKTLIGMFVFGVVAVSLLLISNYEMMIGKRIVSNGMRLFVWYGLILYTCYQSIWGYFAERSYPSAKSIRLLGYRREIPRRSYDKLWRTSAIVLFVVSTTGFIIGIMQLTAR